MKKYRIEFHTANGYSKDFFEWASSKEDALTKLLAFNQEALDFLLKNASYWEYTEVEVAI